jgi:hypothetical protein
MPGDFFSAMTALAGQTSVRRGATAERVGSRQDDGSAFAVVMQLQPR